MRNLWRSAGIGAVTGGIMAGLALLPSQAGAQESKLESTKVTIGIGIVDASFLPIFLADEEGYFKEEGLSAEVIAFRGGSDLTRALVAESVDIALAAPTSVLASIKAEQDVKVFFGGFTMMPFSWYAVPPIKTMEDAKGKRFGITRFGSSSDALTRYVAEKSGLDPEKDIVFIQGGGSAERLAAMEAGQLDAGLFSSPHNFIAAERGYNLIIRQSDVMPDFPIQSFYARQEYIDSHPETIKAVLRGFIKGVRLAKTDKARAVKTIVAKTGIEEKYASQAYDEMVDGWHEDGLLASEGGMKAFFDMAIASGDIDEPWPREKYWDDRFVSTIDQWKPAE